MYLTDLIQGFDKSNGHKDFVEFEYRLICSGEIYNSEVETFDYRKSVGCRLLLNGPFSLFVCSEFNQYPLELCLRFSLPRIEERSPSSVIAYHPDEEIARDISAVLTLYFRRLITVSCKTREDKEDNEYNYPNVVQKWPVAFTSSINKIAWKQKPAILVTKPDNGKVTQEVINYNPPLLGIKPSELLAFLNMLSRCEYVNEFILAARLYTLALQKIEDEVDISYALLVPCIESLANSYFEDYQPTDEEKIDSQAKLIKAASKYNLSKDDIKQLALTAASQGQKWNLKKFLKFIEDFCTDKIWEKDELFKLEGVLLPSKVDFEKALKTIYNSRSEFQHQGKSFPEVAKIGGGPTISIKASHSLLSGEKFPSIYWFERVVNLTLKNFLIRSSMGAQSNSAGIES